jgi:hypothetical protein
MICVHAVWHGPFRVGCAERQAGHCTLSGACARQSQCVIAVKILALFFSHPLGSHLSAQLLYAVVNRQGLWYVCCFATDVCNRQGIDFTGVHA